MKAVEERKPLLAGSPVKKLKQLRSEISRLQQDIAGIKFAVTGALNTAEHSGKHLDLDTPLEGCLTRRAKLQQNVNLFFQRRDHGHVEAVFNLHKDKEKGLILMENFRSALQELGLALKADEVEALFFTMDIDNNHGLSLDEFKRAIERPSKLEQWAETIPLGQLLASCFVVGSGEDPLRAVSSLSSCDIDDAADVFVEGLKKLIVERQLKLQKSFEALDQKSKGEDDGTAAKFATFKMSCGGTYDFHKGLLERIGFPNPKMKEGIHAEHCLDACSQDVFVTDNYNVTTYPCKEYEIATGIRECPERDKLDKMGKPVRVVPNLEKLKKLPLTADAGLFDFEILAAVLYSGPMFQVYNMILRQFPAEGYNKFKSGVNLFTTSIHVLVSAVTKIARVMRLPEGLKLFRGLGGLMELPDRFWKADEFRCRGYMEWGFLSTSSSKATAIQYSGVREGRPHAMLLEVTVGSIDRGASIGDYSQYPEEREFLWVPCSFLEPTGGTVIEVVPEGVVSIIPVRINANLKALTVEQILSQKRDMHIATFRYAIDELRRDLDVLSAERGAEQRLAGDKTRVFDGHTYTVHGFLDKKVQDCEAVLARHTDVPQEHYYDDAVYRGLVIEMLESKTCALSALRHYLEDPSSRIQLAQRLSLKSAHRYYVAFLTRALPAAAGEARGAAALELCRVMGLVRDSVNEEDDLGHTRIMSAGADGMGLAKLELLVAAGASVNGADSSGRTPLYLAACFGHVPTVTALHQLGADVEQPDRSGCTPLYAAADNGHRKVIVALCGLGAKVNRARTDDGRAPLHTAAQYGYVEVVEELCLRGADVHVASRFGTPLELARQNQQAAAIEMLQRHGAQ